MSKVAGMRWSALLLGIVAGRPGQARAPVRRTLEHGLLGAGFTLVAAASALADGRTPGGFAVSAAGEAQYSIPIAAPPGINGLAPQLALTYGHHHPGTLAGVGWGISGLSSIQRCAKTVTQNGEAAAPQNNVSDRYCLDGLQLRHYSGNYGQAGSTYRTEIESHARVTAAGAAGNGPASFKVETRDGLIYEYGATDDSQILSLGQLEARVWAVNRISDRAGNQIMVSWHDDTANGSHRISRVDYATNSIVFQWESKPVGEVRSGFVTGSKVREIHRLQAIEVWQGSSALRRYDLNYEGPLSTTSRSRLGSIRECAGSDCRNATTFAYQDGSAGLLPEAESSQLVPAGAWPLDVNGDGRDDLVFVSSATSGSGTWRVMFASGSGGYATPASDSLQSNLNYAGAIPIDYNHDGLGDILVPGAGSSPTWFVMLGSVTGLGALTDTKAPASTGGRGSNARALDIDGDGRDDLVWADLVGYAGGDCIKYRLRSTSGTGFGPEAFLVDAQLKDNRIVNGAFADWAQKQPGRTPDFNGDGRGDIAYRHERQIWNDELQVWDHTRTVKAICVGGGCSFSTNLNGGAGRLSFGDFNGDGLTDLFYYGGQVNDRPNSATWWYTLSRGTSFATRVEHDSLNLPFTLDWVILDWDADGYDDVLAGYGTSGEWRLARATGLGIGSFGAVNFYAPPGAQVLVADLDGNGLDDFAYSVGGTWRYRRHAGVTPDLLKRVTDGYGNAIEVDYAPLTASGVHRKTSGATFPEQEWQGPMTVVTGHRASDGIGGTYSISHTYEGARRHEQGRAFEGFRRHIRVDDRNGLKTVEELAQVFPHTGSLELTELRQANDTLIEQSDPLLSVVAPGGGLESRTMSYASRITQRQYGVGPTYNGALLRTIVTDTTLDAATGTPTEIKVTTSEASGANGLRAGMTWTERTVNSQLLTSTVGANWCVGRPQRTEQINSHSVLPDGSAQTRTLATSWDAVYCRPTQQLIEPDSPQWRMQTDLAYDGFGNLKTQTIRGGIGLTPRVWQTDWGLDGRFPVKLTNPLAQVTQRSFDARTGSLSSETDPNGIANSWTYDGFGRRNREVLPDLTRTDWTYTECLSNCGQNRLIVTATQKSTDGGTIRTDVTHLDAQGRPILTRTQLLGGGYSRVEQQFDDLGRLARVSAPCIEGGCPASPYWTVSSYDLLGRPTQVSRPFTSTATQTISIAYAGLTTTTTDPVGKLSTRIEDGQGRLARSADDDGYSQTFDFDAFGNPVRVTDSNSKVLQQASFNVRGLRMTVTDADLGAWQYDYNVLGEPKWHKDALSKQTDYTWDALGRPLTRVIPDGTGSITRTWTWGTNAAAKEIGRLKESKVEGTSVTSYREVRSYDSKGRPAQTEYHQGTGALSSIGTINVAYDATTGLVDSLTYPVSTASYRLKLKYEYDKGLLKRVRDFNTPATAFWEATTMDANGLILDETLGNGLKTIRGVEPRTGLLESITSGPLTDLTARQDLVYVWDRAGNMLSRQDRNQSLVEAFTYDDLHRLTRTTRNGVESRAISYAANGNVMTQSGVGTYVYDPGRLHAVSSITAPGAATRSFAYDANGSMTSRNGTELLWFADNSVKRIRKTAGSASNSSEFEYGPDGQRWYHKYNVGGAIQTHVNLGGLLEIVAKGAVDDFRHTIHANGVPVALYSRKSTGTNTLRYLLRDHLGSVDVITTSAGAVELQTSFAAFGERRKANWNGAVPSADVAALRDITRHGYTDHEMLDQIDPDLIHMNGRVYDPQIARFVSADPFIDGIANTQGWNRYSYVGNNPLSYTDPSGYLGVPNGQDGSADSPPGRNIGSPYCAQMGGVSVCLGGGTGIGWRYDQPFARDLSWEQAFGHFHRRRHARAGTENYLPQLGQAAGEDFGGVADAATVFADWWNSDNTLPSCSIGCAKAWNGDAGSALAPQQNTSSNGERTLNTVLGLASVYPVGIVPRVGVAVAPAASTAARLASTNGVVRRFEQPAEQIYYRVYSESMVGQWVTAMPPRSSAWARDALALPPGNTATFLQRVRVPAGTLVERSRALRVPEWGRMRGGAEQFQLLDEVPLGNFGPGVPLP